MGDIHERALVAVKFLWPRVVDGVWPCIVVLQSYPWQSALVAVRLICIFPRQPSLLLSSFRKGQTCICHLFKADKRVYMYDMSPHEEQGRESSDTQTIQENLDGGAR